MSSHTKAFPIPSVGYDHSPHCRARSMRLMWLVGILILSLQLSCSPAPKAIVPRRQVEKSGDAIQDKPDSPKVSKSVASSTKNHSKLEAVPTFDFSALDKLINKAIERKKMPGCVIRAGRADSTLFTKAYGNRMLLPEPAAMTADTIFDLASLTKPIATATSIMLLVEQGRIDLDRPIADYLNEFVGARRGRITVRQAMIHSSGLPKVNPLRDYESGYEEAIAHLLSIKPETSPGSNYLYSDIGYLILGEMVRRVSGRGLNEFAREHIYSKLGMKDTLFYLDKNQKQRAAPTELRDDKWIVGVVHDPRAYRLGGVAGNAGLFSTVADLSLYARMMLKGGTQDGKRVLSQQSVQMMTTPHMIGDTIRALGWDIRSSFSSNRGHLLSARAFGHGGFTGTVMWIDPRLDLYVIFLSNRVHPDGKGDVNRLAGAVMNMVVSSLGSSPKSTSTPVKTGIDVLSDQNFKPLYGKKVGLIVNATSRSRNNVSTVTLLKNAPGVELVALFAPEHGLYSDSEGIISDGTDQKSGLPVYSLFGKTRSPTEAMLRGIDTLVFDIQDVGTRFFTYMSTLHQILLAAAKSGHLVMVLDRPNPIDGSRVEGPLQNPLRKTFVNYHSLPVRHGMTVGEIALLLNSELNIHAKLQIIQLQGWNRRTYFDQTGLPWTNPSPNIRTPMQELLYPAIGLLESTNLSVGRGTDSPFEIFGAPWLNHLELVHRLQNSGLPGVSFVPVEFTPIASKYKNKRCFGVRTIVLDRRLFLPIRTALEIARQLLVLHRGKWSISDMIKLVGNQHVMQALRSGQNTHHLEKLWEPDLYQFMKRRENYLLYTDEIETSTPIPQEINEGP